MAQYAEDSIAVVEPNHVDSNSTIYFDSIESTSNIPLTARKIPDSIVQKLKRDESYWYANLAPEKKKEQKVENTPTHSIFEKRWVRTLIWLLIIGIFLSVLIFYLASSNIRLFRKPSSVIPSDEDVLTTEDIFSLQFDKEIEKAITSENYRLATRLMYLQILKVLSDRDLIEFRHEKTNSDYLFQLAGTSFYKDFFRLTREFDFTWYGQFPLTAQTFASIQKDFYHFKQQLQA